MNGVPVSADALDPGARGGDGVDRAAVGDWPSGLYCARLRAETAA